MATSDDNPRKSHSSLLAETEEFLGIHHHHQHNDESKQQQQPLNALQQPQENKTLGPEENRVQNTNDVHRYTSTEATTLIPQLPPATQNVKHLNRPPLMTRDSGHLTPPPSPPHAAREGGEEAIPQHEGDSDGILAKGAEAHESLDMVDSEIPYEEKGAAQVEHGDTEVKDLGWNESASKDVASPMVGGVRNEEVWMLVRRFNKIMYHVRTIDTTPPGGLDLHTSADEEFSPDKLRAELERLYVTVVVGIIAGVKQIARLRSWSERKRTGIFCGVYFLACALNLVGPLLLTTLFAMIVSTRARKVLFPPAPLALTSSRTGEITQPRAGMLGSGDSLTGAPQQHEGEAVEQEAEQVIAGFSNIAVNAAIGKHRPDEAPPAETEIDPDTHEKKVVGNINGDTKRKAEEVAPDVATVASKAVEAKEAGGGKDAAGKDKVKKDVNNAMWDNMKPVLTGVEAASDIWEMFGNALSPTPPFPKRTPLKLGAIILPAVLAAPFITPNMIARGLWIGLGLAFFTDPLTGRTIKFLNEKFPNWMDMLDLHNTLLKGIPTNAQLTITLLRIGESNRTPIVPPPGDLDESHDLPSKKKTMDVNAHELPMDDVTHGEVQNAVQPSITPDHEPHNDDENKKKPGKSHKALGALVGMFKGTTKGGVSAVLATNVARANLGSVPAKQKLGVVPDKQKHKEENLLESTNGPVEFPCRYRGVTGKAYIITSAASPCLSFAPDKRAAKKHDGNLEHDSVTSTPEASDAEWTIPVAKIREVRKVGGLGWKGKMVVGWSMDRQVVDGLEVIYEPEHSLKPKPHPMAVLHHGKKKDIPETESKILTAVVERDGLFNRLISMGKQRWESL